MISGIMPCSGWERTGYPWRLAMRCWARVCDELVVVAHGMGDVPMMLGAAAETARFSEAEGRRCEVLVRSVREPALSGFGGYGSYLMFGVFMASEPDWVLSVEADYLVSPGEAARLRSLLEASRDSDVVTARAVTLNYDGANRLHNPDFARWYAPRDGFSWDRPIGCAPKRGVFPVPYDGTDRRNLLVNCEGYMALRPGLWGLSYNSKFIDHNPNGLALLRSGVEFEHPQFTRHPESLAAKLGHEYFASCGLTVARVLEGDGYYPRRYPDLEAMRAEYADRAETLYRLAHPRPGAGA